jgi:hypothetical protein
MILPAAQAYSIRTRLCLFPATSLEKDVAYFFPPRLVSRPAAENYFFNAKYANTDWTNNIVHYRLSPHCTICLIPSAYKIYKILAYYINHIGISLPGFNRNKHHSSSFTTDWTNNIVQYRLSPHCTICLIPSALIPIGQII